MDEGRTKHQEPRTRAGELVRHKIWCVTEETKEPQVRVVDRRWWARDDKGGNDVAATVSTKPTYVEELERRVDEAKNQLQTYINEHRRSLEEFEQVRVRIRRDNAREVERGKRSVLIELLDVVDNLDRAIGAAREVAPAPGSDAAENLLRGVELVRDQFLAKLEGFGVVRVPALGQAFDAAHHEAVTTTTVSHPAQDGNVIAVLKEGYAIGDELLRPASVVVGKFA
jgi:molecular chaperone GrpE